MIKIYDIVLVLKHTYLEKPDTLSKILELKSNEILDTYVFEYQIAKAYFKIDRETCKFIIFRIKTDSIWDLKKRNQLLKECRKIQEFIKFKVLKLSNSFKNIKISETCFLDINNKHQNKVLKLQKTNNDKPEQTDINNKDE